MKNKFLLIFFFTSTTILFSQTDGDMAERKEAILSSNNVTSVFFNYGSINKPNYLPNIADFVWRELGYIREAGPLVAAKVLNDNGDSVLIVDDSFVLPTQGSYSPDGTLKWGWLPRPGYSNPNSNNFATANNPASWHPSWTQWQGEFGDGVIIGQDEGYFVMDDFTNRMANYFPFPNDTSKRGLGLKAEVRIYQFGNALKDAVVIKYKLTNESPKNLDKLYFGFHGVPHVGGPSNFSDDRMGFVKFTDINNSNLLPAFGTIYNWDDDMLGDGGKPAYYMNFKLLKTPDNKGLTSFHAAPWTSSLPNVPKNTLLMWQWLSEILIPQAVYTIMLEIMY